ncbi:hypothetical protein GCM10027408_35870 [Microbacterium tumbae]
MFEIELSSEEVYENPFLDVELRATFTHGGTSETVDGFYDGEEDGRHVWRVRFAPMDEGRWSYRTESGDAALVAEGGFDCTPPVSSGSLRLSSRFGNWFEREDGSHTFIANDGWFPHVANRVGRTSDFGFEDVDFPQPSEADWYLYLDFLAEHRINFVVDIAQLYARQSTITDTSFRWPWKVLDAEANKVDRDRFNLDFYQRADRQVAYAKDKGIFFAMELLYDNSVVRPREWGNHPSNVANGGWLEGDADGVGWSAWFDLDNPVHMEYVRRYVRYTWARYGAYWNVVWSIGSENGNLARINDERLPQAFIAPEIPAAWYAYWVDFLNRRDPYARLKSYGDAGRQELMVSSAYNNFIITQDPRNYPKDDVRHGWRAMNAFGEMMWKFGRPVVVGEMTAGNNGQYDAERRLYWIAFTAGYAMGRSDRHFATIVDGRLAESAKFDLDGAPPIYEDIRRQVEFVESRGVRFWRMRPNDRLIDTPDDLVYCLAAEDEEYVLYYAEGGEASLDAPRGRGEWFNPRDGQAQLFSVEAGRRTFTAPDEGDWVLYLRAE